MEDGCCTEEISAAGGRGRSGRAGREERCGVRVTFLDPIPTGGAAARSFGIPEEHLSQGEAFAIGPAISGEGTPNWPKVSLTTP